jgi:2-haloacid dehalogenase
MSIRRRDFLVGAAAGVAAGCSEVEKSGAAGPGPRGFVFDAYGTLFDPGGVVRAAREITPEPEALSQVWRQKQIEYTWLRALMGRYEDFWRVTEDALIFAIRKFGLSATDRQVAGIMDQYMALPAFPDVDPTLRRLEGRALGILSNGSPAMLEAVVRSSGLSGRFQHVLSADQVRSYKPSSAVYALATRAFGSRARDLVFVSSNAWDAAGAKGFGYQVCWCNRQRTPAEILGVKPDVTVERLDQLPERFGL